MKRIFSLVISLVCMFGAQAGAQTTYSFVTCGATGAAGPSQAACDAAYSATNLNGLVTVSGGIQQWTVPSSGTYRIDAIGAQGASAQSGFAGGRGAQTAGDVALTAGQVLQLAVGQAGQAVNYNGSGGGGSFVVDMATTTPLIIAGGGGGTRRFANQNGCDASITQFGVTGSGSSSSGHGCSNKVIDVSLGGRVSAVSWGSGGGGFLGDGQDDLPWGQGGFSWANGMTGGLPITCATLPPSLSDGGFGGGGSGNGCGGGGGGGGYSGGDGGFIAGGGGSFNSGTNQLAATGVGIGDGSVSITILDSDGDGVLDGDDFCPDTIIPEGVPTTGELNPNHWALTANGNGFDFDTVIKGKGKGPNRSYTIEDTAGCSCEQIIEAQGLGDGHTMHGCSISAMDDWVALVTP